MKPSRNPNAPGSARRPAGQAENPGPGSRSENEASFSSRPSHDDIARRAYQHWESSGRSEGNDQDHWYNAERELSGESRSQTGNQSRQASSVDDGSGETRREEP